MIWLVLKNVIIVHLMLVFKTFGSLTHLKTKRWTVSLLLQKQRNKLQKRCCCCFLSGPELNGETEKLGFILKNICSVWIWCQQLVTGQECVCCVSSPCACLGIISLHNASNGLLAAQFSTCCCNICKKTCITTSVSCRLDYFQSNIVFKLFADQIFKK